MRYRWIAVTVILAMAVAMGSITPMRVAGQAPDNSASSTAPRTSWGHPDLQGVWNFVSDAPMERPARGQ